MSGEMGRRKVKKVRLSRVPKSAIGETGEILTLVKLWELGLDGVLCRRNMERVDIFTFDPISNPPTKRTVTMVPVQVKSISLRKHGEEIEIGAQALKEFEGWYVFLLEAEENKSEDEDIYLYISGNTLRELIAKYGTLKNKTNYLSLYANPEIVEMYSDSTEFVDAVKKAGLVVQGKN